MGFDESLADVCVRDCFGSAHAHSTVFVIETAHSGEKCNKPYETRRRTLIHACLVLPHAGLVTRHIETWAVQRGARMATAHAHLSD